MSDTDRIQELANHLCQNHIIYLLQILTFVTKVCIKKKKKPQRIQVGNGQFIGVLFIVPDYHRYAWP